MMERIETVIVGGGQAGLATSYYLREQGREHVVLEQAAQAGNAWRNGRWDSFTLVTPNWTIRMPGAEYTGPDREGFMPRDEVVAYFEQYVERFALPVRYNTHVVSVEAMNGQGYCVETAEGAYEANNVVMATGFEQKPKIAAFGANLSPDIVQLHSGAYRNPGRPPNRTGSDPGRPPGAPLPNGTGVDQVLSGRYRNPASLPEGAALVVGSAQSGAQIAEELYQHGRQVYLSTGSAGRAPRRYRGKDVVEWLTMIGFFDMTPDKLPVPKEHFAPPHVSGARGGHALNLHQFARDGVTLLGHLRGAAGDKIHLAPDLHQNLGKADGFELQVQKMVDGYIQANGLDAPAEELPQLRDGYQQAVIEELDLKAAGISSVIWATGYRFDYSLVKLPVRDPDGFPIQSSGVTRHAGLYFVGMPFMPTLKSGVLAGVGAAAEHIAGRIGGRGD